MTVKKARAHENLCQGPKFGLQVASYAGNSLVDGLVSGHSWTDSSTRNVASLREGLEVVERDSEARSLHGLLDDRREGNGNITGMHREGTAFECNDGDDGDDGDENDNNDNNEDKDDNEDDDSDNHSDNDDLAFVEDSLRCRGVDTSRRERMQSLYEVRFTRPSVHMEFPIIDI